MAPVTPSLKERCLNAEQTECGECSYIASFIDCGFSNVRLKCFAVVRQCELLRRIWSREGLANGGDTRFFRT